VFERVQVDLTDFAAKETAGLAVSDSDEDDEADNGSYKVSAGASPIHAEWFRSTS
jgi:hypothetical protein